MKKAMAMGLIGLTVATAVVSAHGFEKTEEMKQAIDNNDYEAFVLAVSEKDPQAAERISQERFERMVKRSELKDAAHDAIEAQDYEQWVSAVSALPHGAKIAEIVTEDEFSTLIKLHQARKAGDKETARELATELGLKKPRHGRH